jgi:glycerol-3-phosphate dehydrogenase (NAD(P)+)
MQVAFLGKGVFGTAIGSLVEANGYAPEYVDMGDTFSTQPDILFLAVPAQALRSALTAHYAALRDVHTIVNCSKGIESKTGLLPHQIVSEVRDGNYEYIAVSGPSFASEIIAEVPTTVSIAGTSDTAITTVANLLTQPFFVLEALGTVLELELAGAMKNVYALASGYVAGSGGGKNTLAHVQVVALREYTKLVHTLEGNTDVVRPGVVGDLILTAGSSESRNYQFGFALAKGDAASGLTAEGVATAEAIQLLVQKQRVSLPLSSAVEGLIRHDATAHGRFYKALGFDL